MKHSDVHSRAVIDLDVDALTSCVRAGISAPSLHNSQPWRFRIHDGGIDVFTDRRRQLDLIDPVGRELLLSVGAAVFNSPDCARRRSGIILRP